MTSVLTFLGVTRFPISDLSASLDGSATSKDCRARLSSAALPLPTDAVRIPQFQEATLKGHIPMVF